MTEFDLREKLSEKACEVILDTAESNLLRFGTDINTSLKIGYNALTRSITVNSKTF